MDLDQIDKMMDLDQLGKIQKPMMNAILLKMGYTLKTCRHVVFGPRKYLGIGARDLVMERGGMQQTLMFVRHIRSDQDFKANYSTLDSNGSNFMPALLDPYLTVPCSKYHTWK